MSDNVNVSYDFLPVEIVTQILIHLPIKSIITCTSVSKTWKSIIKNPTFISTHLHLSIKSNNNLNFLRLFSLQNKKLYALYNDDDDGFTEHTMFDFPLKPLNSKRTFYAMALVGICNGLVCLCDDSHINTEQFYLWNPCVRKFVKLPLPDVSFQSGKKHIGFGFDSKTNDYKVVSVVSLEVDPNILKEQPKVEVYSLSTGVWRIITTALSMGLSIGLLSGGPALLQMGPALPPIPSAIGFKRNGKVMLEMGIGKLTSQDLETQEKKYLRITSYYCTFFDSYVESLILLDKVANGAVTY